MHRRELLEEAGGTGQETNSLQPAECDGPEEEVA